jgi:hypothetical protein
VETLGGDLRRRIGKRGGIKELEWGKAVWVLSFGFFYVFYVFLQNFEKFPVKNTAKKINLKLKFGG